MKASDDLEQGASKMERFGWYRGGDDVQESYCPIMVLQTFDAIRSLSRAISVTTGHTNVPYWNDNEAESKEEVIATMRRVAAELRKQGK